MTPIKIENSRLRLDLGVCDAWHPEVVALFHIKVYEYRCPILHQNLFLNKELSAVEEHMGYLLYPMVTTSTSSIAQGLLFEQPA